VSPTHRHTQTTLRATLVAIGHIYAVHAMRPINSHAVVYCAIIMAHSR